MDEARRGPRDNHRAKGSIETTETTETTRQINEELKTKGTYRRMEITTTKERRATEEDSYHQRQRLYIPLV